MKLKTKKNNQAKTLVRQFDLDIPDSEPIFPIKIACKLLNMHYWVLHDIIKEGILEEEEKQKKLLSFKDIKRLKYVKYLIEERGVNIKGIKVIFEIEHPDNDI